MAIISRAFATKYFPGSDPIGHYFTPTFPDTNEPVLGRQIVGIVGDTRNDVIAARENGIRSIAVRTGVSPPGELEDCCPDHLFNDLTEFDFSII